MAGHQLAKSQVVGQSDRKDQPGIGHQAVVVKGDGGGAGRGLGWLDLALLGVQAVAEPIAEEVHGQHG